MWHTFGMDSIRLRKTDRNADVFRRIENYRETLGLKSSALAVELMIRQLYNGTLPPPDRRPRRRGRRRPTGGGKGVKK